MSQQLQAGCCCEPPEPCPPCGPPLCFTSYAAQITFSGSYVDTLDGNVGSPEINVDFEFSGVGTIQLANPILCRWLGIQSGTLIIQADAPWSGVLSESSATEYACGANVMATFVDYQFPFTNIRRLIDFRSFGVPVGPCVIDVQAFMNANRVLRVTRPGTTLPPLPSLATSYEIVIT